MKSEEVHIIRFRPAKTYLESEKGARGENGLSVSDYPLSLRQNKDSRRVGGHAPPQRHLERSAATTKTRFTGRKQNKRSEFCCLPVLPERGGQRGRKRVKRKRLPVVVPVKIKIPVASVDMRRHSDTLRGAQRRRKRGSRGENRISGANSVVFPSFPERGGQRGRKRVKRKRLPVVFPVLIQTISTSLPFSADSYMPLSIFCMSIACSMG